MTSVTVRLVRPGEAPLVLGFIRELAEYEHLSDQVEADEAGIEALLFGPEPRAFCDIAEVDGAAVGFALWFYNVSTFKGRCGIYIEDLYVRPEARGQGAGRALVAGLARRCVEQGLGRVEWAVLKWNTPSIAFYDRLGAAPKDEWALYGLGGEALAKLARR